MAEKRPSVFISYSQQDSLLAHKMADALHNDGIKTWFDQPEAESISDEWSKRLVKALNSSSAVLFIVSPHSLTSPSNLFELGVAQGQHKPVIAVIAEPIGAELLDDVPKSLKQLVASAESSSPGEVAAKLIDVLKLQHP